MSKISILSRLKPAYSVYRNISILLFTSTVVVLFIYLNRVQPHYFIDEVFHIPQTLRYCDKNFTQWDPKITTLPGLYLLTASILSPLNLCQTIYIRCNNLFGTFANLYLAFNLVKEKCVTEKAKRWDNWMKLTVAYNITLLPPLFFWHFLYYTDVVSVTVVLLMWLMDLNKRFKCTALVGIIAVFIRQTNIIWLAFLTLERALDVLESKMKKSVPLKHHNSAIYLKILFKEILREAHKGPVSFIKFIIQLCMDLVPYITVCLIFLAFVVWNRGIVVGDRTAHVPTIHIPQLFYFSLFAFGFSWPYMLVHWRNYLSFIKSHRALACGVLALLIAVVHFNTLVHPYVLADNRHYVFYFWNKFMGRYPVFKYLLTPVYSFTLYTMYRGINHLRITTQINYLLMTSAVLVPQLLLEPRYFIIPFIFYRLSLKRPGQWQLVLEVLTILTVNFAQFFIFANKVFYWADQPHAQRIAW